MNLCTVQNTSPLICAGEADGFGAARLARTAAAALCLWVHRCSGLVLPLLLLGLASSPQGGARLTRVPVRHVTMPGALHSGGGGGGSSVQSSGSGDSGGAGIGGGGGHGNPLLLVALLALAAAAAGAAFSERLRAWVAR